MKFSLLTVGQQFEYQGETYIKSTPLIAHQVDTGEQRLIPRSATVVSTNQPAIPSAGKTPCVDPCIDPGELQQAFMELEESLRDTLEQDARLARAFDRARQRFFQRLSIAPVTPRTTENHSSS